MKESIIKPMITNEFTIRKEDYDKIYHLFSNQHLIKINEVLEFFRELNPKQRKMLLSYLEK